MNIPDTRELSPANCTPETGVFISDDIRSGDAAAVGDGDAAGRTVVLALHKVLAQIGTSTWMPTA